MAKVSLLIFIAFMSSGRKWKSISGANNFRWFMSKFSLPNLKLLPVPPTQVTIVGPTEARQGDIVSFQCLTAPSNPAAEIRWTIDQRQRRTNVSSTLPSNEGGVITTSNISITVDSNKRQFLLLCQGINMQLADNVMTTHMLHILCKFLLNCPWNSVANNLLPLSRSAFDSRHFRLYRRLRDSGWLQSKALMHVFRWQSASNSHMVQERQEGK